MSKEHIKKIILIISIILLFVIILVEASKSNPGIQLSDYANYESKYNGLVNQINYIKVNDFSMTQKYLSDFVDTCMTNRKEAYELIDPYYKGVKLQNYSRFDKLLDNMISKVFIEAKVDSYKIKSIKNYRYYYVRDAAGNEFVFKEDGIMNYTVYLDMVNLDF